MAKRKIEAVQIDDLNVTVETKEIQKNSNIGRPKKFNKKLTKPINIYFSDGQLEAIDKRVSEIGFGARVDYFRKLLRTDIPNFDEY